MTKKRILAALAAVAVLASAFCMNSFASTTRKKISKVSITIEGVIHVDDRISDSNIEVTTSSDHYSMDEYEFTNTAPGGNAHWTSDDVPEMKIYLNAETGYYFNISGTSQITVIGGTVTAATRESNDEGTSGVLVVTVTLPSLANQVSAVDEASVNADGICTWSAVENAGNYEVKFMRNNATLGGVQTVTGTTLDCGKYMTKAATYHFMIRAINKNDAKTASKWIDSAQVTIGAEQAKAHADKNASDQSAGTWEQDGAAWKFRLPEGTYVMNAWRMINNVWYYFNGDSTMATGWVFDNGKWYYMDQASGAMLRNSTTPDGYFVGIDGVWAQ